MIALCSATSLIGTSMGLTTCAMLCMEARHASIAVIRANIRTEGCQQSYAQWTTIFCCYAGV